MLHEYIPAAIEAIEERDKPPSPIQQHDDRVDILVDLIASQSRIDPDELRIPEENYKSRIETIIQNVSDSPEPISDFDSEIDKLEGEIKDDYQEFTILFPWSLWPVSADTLEHPVEIRDLAIQQAHRSYWEEYREIAVEESTFDRFLEEVPTRKNRSSPF